MNKHAYLIMAHNNWDNLERLIQLIDDVRNDIYLHIDKKATGFNINRFLLLPKYSRIYIYSEIKIYWGGYSVVECELLLLKEAIEYGYLYYHLLSGADLPIKSQDEIHRFFQRNRGYEFVHYQTEEYIKSNAEIARRVTVTHYLQNYRKRFRYAFLNNCFTMIDKGLIAIQLLLRINNWEDNYELKYGSNWVSITNNLAKFLVQSEDIIKQKFGKANCGDELFIQTLVFNSRFKDKLYNQNFNNEDTANMRLIDWSKGNKKGNPYVWRKKDFQQIMESRCLFARKFDYNVDRDIIEKIYRILITKNSNNASNQRRKMRNTAEGCGATWIE
jgi:hypothetical protein